MINEPAIETYDAAELCTTVAFTAGPGPSSTD